MLLYNPQHNDGLRVQGFYVGDPGDADFDNVVGAYVGDIITQWPNVRPHWSVNLPPAPEMVQSGLPLVELAGGDAESNLIGAASKAVEFDQSFVIAMMKKYENEGAKFSINAIRKAHGEIYGSECRNDRAKRLYNAIVGAD
jgi:hypothetical protein